jgi:transposase
VLVRAPSGRQRFNVLGALHAITHQLITVTNDSYINANCVCELLEKIAALGLCTPITVVMDNARYQRCRLVLEKASQLGLELLFLPPYSPHLNLIERLWRGRSAKNVSTTPTTSTLTPSSRPSPSV